MISGKMALVVNLGVGDVDLYLESLTGSFNDGKWHNVTISRKLQKVKYKIQFLFYRGK